MKTRESMPLIISAISILAVLLVFFIYTPNIQRLSEEVVHNNVVDIKIIEPYELDTIPQLAAVTVFLKIQSEADDYYWLLVRPYETNNLWYPQGDGHPIYPINVSNGLWHGLAVVGTESDNGKYFDIAVVSIGSQGNQLIKEWFETNTRYKSWPGMKLPYDAKIMDKVSVIRG